VAAFVRREFEAHLRRGVLDHGFLRVRCDRCGDTAVVAFSCRGRGFCPSCGGRRMSELAAHLMDHVLPHVPIRQWVFTVPAPIRYQLAFDAGLTRAVLRVFLRTVFGWQGPEAARPELVGAYGSHRTLLKPRARLETLAAVGRPLLAIVLLLVGGLTRTGGDELVEAWMVDRMPQWLIDLTTSV
jgi:hypothetical protein